MSDKKLLLKRADEIPSIILRCECAHKDHMVVIEYDSEFDEYIVFMQMDHFQPFLKRVRTALRFLRGKKYHNCHFVETVVYGDEFRSRVKNLIGTYNDNNI